MDQITPAEIFGLMLTAGGLVVAIMTLHHSLKARRQKSQKELIADYERHEARMKSIENDTANVRRETQVIQREVENLRNERTTIVAQLTTQISDLRRLHDDDIDTVHVEIKELVAEVRNQNESDHKELKTILSVMNERLITICTQFADHKESLKARTRAK